MCFKRPKFDSVQKLEEELEEGGGIVFDGGLDVEAEDGYDDIMWGQTGMDIDVTEMAWTGTIQVRKICLVLYLVLPGHMAWPGSVQSGA